MLQGITVLLGTVSLDAIGYMSSRKSTGILWSSLSFAPASFSEFCIVSTSGKYFFQVSVFLGRSSRKCEKKNGLPKLYNILEKQSGKTWAFVVYFVSLEFLNRNKYSLMNQELSCRNYACILNIKLYRKKYISQGCGRLVRPCPISFRTSRKFLFTCPWISTNVLS